MAKRKIVDALKGYIPANVSTQTVTPQLEKVSYMTQYLSSLRVYGTQALGGAQTSDSDSSTALDKDMLVNFICFSCAVDLIGGSSSATNPRWEFFINDVRIITIMAPSSAITSPNWAINQVIDVTDFLLKAGSVLKITLTCDAVATRYDGVSGFSISGLSV